MLLCELISALKRMNPDGIVKHGFDGDSAHSWRGVYSELAFEPMANAKVSDMLKGATEALGKTFEGYKGGDNVMDAHTSVHFSAYGKSDDFIGAALLSYWKADAGELSISANQEAVSMLESLKSMGYSSNEVALAMDALETDE